MFCAILALGIPVACWNHLDNDKDIVINNNDPIVNDNINVVNIIDPSGNHQLMVTQIQLFYTTYGDPQNP